MSVFSKSLLLFLLNWLDAQLTILWVRGGVATERIVNYKLRKYRINPTRFRG